MKRDIENELRAWFKEMIRKYKWLIVKFEWSRDRSVYLVSFSPEDQIAASESFNRDALAFADNMNDRYGDDAPLFTDEESLFQLSSDAEVLWNMTSTSETIYSADSSNALFRRSASYTTNVMTTGSACQPDGLYYAVAA